MLGAQRSHCHNKTNSGSEGIRQKGQMSSTTDRYRAEILDGHRDRQIRRLRFSRHSHSRWWIYLERRKSGSRVCEPAETKEKTAEEGGTQEEGSSSNRPELAAFVLALRDTPMTNPMLYLCDNQALLKVVKRWVGEGGKAKLVRAPDADILLEAIEELRKRATAGAATFPVKVKAHRGEPANEEADSQADKAISGKDVPTEWHDRTIRAVFTWQEPRRKGGTVSYEDRKSTWNSGVWKAIRR